MDKFSTRFGHRIPEEIYEDYKEADKIFETSEDFLHSKENEERTKELLERMSSRFKKWEKE